MSCRLVDRSLRSIRPPPHTTYLTLRWRYCQDLLLWAVASVVARGITCFLVVLSVTLQLRMCGGFCTSIGIHVPTFVCSGRDVCGAGVAVSWFARRGLHGGCVCPAIGDRLYVFARENRVARDWSWLFWRCASFACRSVPFCFQPPPPAPRSDAPRPCNPISW
jgi:hypothetical protein